MNKGYYPIMIRLGTQRIVVVGGGRVAARKTESLLASGAEELTVVAPNICHELQQLVDDEKLIWRQQLYQPDVLEHATLVFAATNDEQLNEQISKDATVCDILVCNVSEGDLGTFITPAIARSAGFTVAISSSGSSPGLTKHLKQQLELELLQPYEEIRLLMQRLRECIMKSELNEEQRQRMLRLALTEAIAAKENAEQTAYIDDDGIKEKQLGSSLTIAEQYELWVAQLYDRTIQGEGEDTENGQEGN